MPDDALMIHYEFKRNPNPTCGGPKISKRHWEGQGKPHIRSIVLVLVPILMSISSWLALFAPASESTSQNLGTVLVLS